MVLMCFQGIFMIEKEFYFKREVRRWEHPKMYPPDCILAPWSCPLDLANCRALRPSEDDDGDGDDDYDDGGGDDDGGDGYDDGGDDDGGAVVVMMMAVMVMVVVVENAQSSKWVWVIKGRGSDRGVSRTSGYQAIRKSRHINLSPSSLIRKMKIRSLMKSFYWYHTVKPSSKQKGEDKKRFKRNTMSSIEKIDTYKPLNRGL